MTMFIGELDLDGGALEFCNCGHNPPVSIARDGVPSFLPCKANTPVGVVPDYVFEGERISDVRGLPLFLYTDGLTEAENAAHDQFGDERLLAVLGGPYKGAEDVVKRAREAVAGHVGAALASDDLTMLCLEWKG